MTDVSAGFRPPCWCPSRWAPAWRLHTNLYKFVKNVSPHIFRKKNCCDLNLGESLYMSSFFLFPDSRLNRLNGFYFLFWSILNGVTLKTSNRLKSYSIILACFHLLTWLVKKILRDAWFYRKIQRDVWLESSFCHPLVSSLVWLLLHIINKSS